jgi:predicted TIM-barrel fold metal-dependent hydrolase
MSELTSEDTWRASEKKEIGKVNRRELISKAGLLAGTTVASRAIAAPLQNSARENVHRESLSLADYEPKSMLRVTETRTARSRFPVIDTHTHITYSAKSVSDLALSAERVYLAKPKELLSVMDRKNILAMVDLTGGYAQGLVDTVAKYQNAFPGRFYVFTEPIYEKLLEPDYPKLQALEIENAHRCGAKGLKILKALGLYLRENITSGNLVKIDDRRFDPMWDACGQLHMPVAIHIADPLAFFTPTDRFNERYEELHNHPHWSFYGHDFPSVAELIEARNRVFARHPNTRFVALHVGNLAEDLASVSESLERFPNMCVDFAARLGELGRQPRNARRFFDRYQDRIVFGTDATPNDPNSMQQNFCDCMYEVYFRFLETDDEYFDYACSPIPPQGRWRISGINLTDTVLRKVYNQNAARELGVNL